MYDRAYTDLWCEVSQAIGPDRSMQVQELMTEAVKRAEVQILQESADEIDEETKQARSFGILEPWAFRPCRDAADQLREKADDIVYEEIG